MGGNGQIPVLVVAGPTASGKSALAADVAETFDGLVINADSMQLYAELPVLTAQPTDEMRRRAPHALYGVLHASEPCSAARWRELAEREIAAAAADRRLPVLCGGTGLYLKALMEGLASVPDIPVGVRRRIRQRLAREGPAALHAELTRRDPDSAVRIPASDRQRIARALEVLEATGRSLHVWQRDFPGRPPPGLEFFTILLLPPREVLYAEIDTRFRRMLEGGALAEVEALLARGLECDLPAMKAVGVPELARHLAGEIDLAEAVRAAQRATRRYAKRQTTWFRNQIVADLVIYEKYSKRLRPKIFSFIRENVLTAHR